MKVDADFKKNESFFHSRCCDSHFEGKIEDNKFSIVCEKCGKFIAYLQVIKGFVSIKKKIRIRR